MPRISSAAPPRVMSLPCGAERLNGKLQHDPTGGACATRRRASSSRQPSVLRIRQDRLVVLRGPRPRRQILLGREDNLIDRQAILPHLDPDPLIASLREPDQRAVLVHGAPPVVF